MAERIILDPTEEAFSPVRSQFDITPWIAEAGPDWGDSEIQAYMADQSRGATPVDFRVPNRTVQIPLILRALGGTSFVAVRGSVQAKAALFQREGGRLRRTTTAGSTVYADVVNATLKLGGGWLQSAKDTDLDATLSLECSPDFYEAEVTLSDHTETSVSELVFTETTVRGDYPARVEVVVDEDQGQSQLGLIWSFRNRHYSSAATAATKFEAEAMNPLDNALRAALTGASGGTVVTHGTLSTNWTPVLDMRVGGATYPTHTGTNRLWVRYRTTSGTAVQLRAVWDVGDMVFPVENPPVRCNAGTSLFLADLGELRLDPSPVGTHRWNAIIQGKGAVGSENLSIDKVWVVGADEGYGVLTAPVTSDLGLATYSARDEFNQSAGALTGKTAAVGGVWVGAGDADDLSVETTGLTAQRTAVSDAINYLDGGRLVTLNTNMTNTVVQVDLKVSALPTQGMAVGVLARYVDATNFAALVVDRTSSVTTLGLYHLIAGAHTLLTQESFTLAVSEWVTLRLWIDSAGRYSCWKYSRGGAAGEPIFAGHEVLFTTTLATGDVGIVDYHNSATANTRSYDNFAAWAPTSNAVLYASQSAELRWDAMLREDSAGAAYGPVSQVVGDLPRLPPTVESRPTEVFVKGSRGDLDQLPDAGIDDISARITYRPTWLTVPGT